MSTTCPHCGEPATDLTPDPGTLCGPCADAHIRLAYARTRQDLAANAVAMAVGRALRDGIGLGLDVQGEHAQWSRARDARTAAHEAWMTRGKLREQRVGLTSTARLP
jgi:hypothetical protein